MDTETIKPILESMNPWWSSGVVPERDAPATKRTELETFAATLEGPRIPVLSGLRRTGKTTILHQTIAALIERGVRPERLLYVKFDDLGLREMGPYVFQAVLDAHGEMMGAVPGDMTYALFDEVHNIPDWARALKVIWDRKGPLRIAVTGSAGLSVRGGVGESLVGRATTIDLGPMDLADWAALRGISVDRLPLTSLLGAEGPAGALGGRSEVLRRQSDLRPLLGDYLLRGGLPEAALVEDLVQLQRSLYEDVVDRVVLRDIPLVYGVRQAAKLGALIAVIADKSGVPLTVEGLRASVSLQRETVEDYITYLVGASVIIELVSHTGRLMAALKKARKYYIADTGLANAVMHRGSRTTSDAVAMGALAEQAVAIHLDRLARRQRHRLTYAPAHRGSEVDFVLETTDGPLPIECKFRSEVRDREVGRLDDYREGMGAKVAIMVTKDTLGRRGACVLVPLWLFLLTA